MNAQLDPTALEKETAVVIENALESEPMITFRSPTELRNYRPPEGSVLVGHNHIVRGATFVIGGAAGVGKSRASVALAVAGATGQPWFGLKVHRKFKTLIIQNENGRHRLSEEFFFLKCETLDDWLRVSEPPPFGIAINHPDFCKLIAEQITSFQPDLVLIDPWNAVAADDKARDYLETFNAIRRLVPARDTSPALGIVAHTRKPKTDERANGRSLLNTLAGSYVLASIPRAAFVLQAASDNPEDNRVVFTCCKNNDGEMGAPSAWTRGNGIFQAVEDFNWEEFAGKNTSRPTITEESIATALEHGQRDISKTEAVQKLMQLTDCAKSAAYNALATDGRFSANITLGKDGKSIRWNS